MKQEATAAPESAQQIHEALYDGADLQVTFTGGSGGDASSPAPPPEVVKVRKIPRSEFGMLALVIGDDSDEGETQEAALYTARDGAWVKRLDEASLDRVLQEGQRLNFFRFARWFRRRGRMLELMKDSSNLVALATEAMRNDPTLSKLLAATNGSSPRGTATRTSGVTAPTS